MTANAQTMTELFADADRLRHEESMHMARQQYPAQAASTVIQQQMLASQQAQAAQRTQAPSQSEQTQQGE